MNKTFSFFLNIYRKITSKDKFTRQEMEKLLQEGWKVDGSRRKAKRNAITVYKNQLQ
jgi:hypothetical protein